jgi:hypothetical protein
MATQFTEIYEMNEILKCDSRINMKPSNQVYKLYYIYLKYIIGLFFRDCYKDIVNHIPFSQKEYLFKSDGIDNTIVLNSDPLENCKFYIGYAKDSSTAYTEITQYTYDSATKTITIPAFLVPENYLIYISSYVIGSFSCDLDYDERLILSEGMLIPFQKEQQNRNGLLTQMVYGASQKIDSQANHIKSVHSVVTDQEQRVNDLIVKYTYRANPDNLSGLDL